MARHCAQCGAALGERGQFCHRCGAPREGGAGAAPPAARPAAASRTPGGLLPWGIAAVSLLALVGYIAGQSFGRRTTPSVTSAPPAAAGGGARAVDISQMSPQERADRLFQRVMTYVSAGQSDSVTFFAPMAILSFEALAPLDAHQRYDLGLLGLVSGDGAMARAQSDTILAQSPNHLLGLILGMRASGLLGDRDARTRFAAQLQASLAAERAKALPEYSDHAPDIDAAIREIDNPAGSLFPPQQD